MANFPALRANQLINSARILQIHDVLAKLLAMEARRMLAGSILKQVAPNTYLSMGIPLHHHPVQLKNSLTYQTVKQQRLNHLTVRHIQKTSCRTTQVSEDQM